MADVAGTRKDPYRKFQFHVYTLSEGGPSPFDSKSNVHFSEVSGLRGETESVEYKEGTDSLTKKLPGKTSYANIVLARGIDDGGSLAEWRQRIVEDGGSPDAQLRATLVVQLKDRTGTKVVREWRASACWPTSYEAEDLSGGSSEVLIERVELACEKIISTTPKTGAI